MRWTHTLGALLVWALMLMVLPVRGDDCCHDCGRRDGRCVLRHCDRHCRPNPQVVTQTVVMTVTVTNTITRSIPGTETRDYHLEPSHLYRVVVWSPEAREWRGWGLIQRVTSNQRARITLHHDPRRAVLWQVRDVTSGFPVRVLTPEPPDAPEAVNYVLLRRGVLIRVE